MNAVPFYASGTVDFPDPASSSVNQNRVVDFDGGYTRPFSIDHFDNDVDTIFVSDSFIPYDSFLDLYGEADWTAMYEYNNPFAFPPAITTPSDNTSSTGELLSPLSDFTAFDSPMSTMPPDLEFSGSCGMIDTPSQSMNSAVCGLDAADTPAPALSRPPNSSAPFHPFPGYGPPSQPFFGAAADVDSPPLSKQDVHVSAGELPFTFTFPPTVAIVDAVMEDSHATEQEEQAETKPNASRRPVKRKSTDDDTSGDDSEDGGRKPTKRGRRRQDTTRKYACKLCESVFARSYNLNVHMAAVHEGKRGHVCPNANCQKAFSRKHDLVRHEQSRHTNLGSPRRKPVNGEPKRNVKKKN